ncbi:undecaprenyl-phosphate glucose phosphotransferase [Pontibacter sp. 172403-2]|uniref:undecaprenyl-phosphate glucose phosphotransferase n=1 Tax=Pontibacter rufus TaxID=2791028 RepID=UPI0018B00808|nr:undecaprenyl-phosphate glucose phosphotransferase [Pontibacter sp. 172403-2]MBF9253256.1 undecaprenyl-phosphate glucose phosphotransferase [Pontibacter sp. 172403-2]
MTNKYATLFKWIHVVVDFTLLNGTLYACFLLDGIDLVWLDVYDYKLTILLLNFCWSYCSNLFGIYNNNLKRDAVPTLAANIMALCLFVLISGVIKFVLPQLYVPPAPFVYYFALFPALLLLWRFLFLLLRKHKRMHWLKSDSIAIAGAGAVGVEFYNYILHNPQLNYSVAGIFDDDASRVPSYMNYLGKVAECADYASANKISEIYCALPYTESEKIEWLLQEADKHMVRFRVVPDVKGAMHHKFMVELFGYVPVLKTRQEPLENKANEIIKRAFDIVFSAVTIVLVLSWFVPLIALAIKLDSKGPVFFKQLRSGKNNKSFYCLKFRSMTVNSDSDSMQASKSDARVTRMGRFMRKTSIDELPQFINVFLGNMSVVGPRPHMLKHTHDYSKLIDNYMVRHFLTPGITGWAQVNGFRGETKETIAMLNRVKADLWYLENWSILLDMKIIFLTVWQALKKNDNAY